MTTHRIPLPDWRDNVRGMPIASFNGESVKRISTGKDKEAQSAVERISDRPGPNRWSE